MKAWISVVIMTLGFGLGLPTAATAVELIPVSEMRNGIAQYVDRDSIAMRGDRTEYWLHTRFSTPQIQGLGMVSKLMVGNCESGEVQTRRIIAYDSNGKKLLEKNLPQTTVNTVFPDSGEGKALIVACSIQSNTPTAPSR
jgi:hypothetical protein